MNVAYIGFYIRHIDGKIDGKITTKIPIYASLIPNTPILRQILRRYNTKYAATIS
jgi:hypothetical protein